MQPTVKMYAIFARETLVQMKYEGKLAAQAGHAYLHAWWDAEARLAYIYEDGKYGRCRSRRFSLYCVKTLEPYKYNNDARKIALVVDSLDDLKRLYNKYRPHMGATLVEDCGYTVFSEPTITAVGLGPVHSDFFLAHPELDELVRLETLKNELTGRIDT